MLLLFCVYSSQADYVWCSSPKRKCHCQNTNIQQDSAAFEAVWCLAPNGHIIVVNKNVRFYFFLSVLEIKRRGAGEIIEHVGCCIVDGFTYQSSSQVVPSAPSAWHCISCCCTTCQTDRCPYSGCDSLGVFNRTWNFNVVDCFELFLSPVLLQSAICDHTYP